MKIKNIILLILGLLLILVPFFINIYSIYKLISLCLGIIIIDISLVYKKKVNMFLVIYLPILLLIFTYSIDYFKTYTFNLMPIFVFENKINDKVAVYDSILYRVYKCDQELIFDNNYKKNYPCDTLLIDEIDINKLLNEPSNSYNEYKNDFIKVTGKLSKISGTSSVELQAYSSVDGMINGYVKFNDTSKLVVNLKGIDVSKYKIYDYITVVGKLSNYDSKLEILTLDDTKLEEKNLYNEYEIHVIESSENTLKEYLDNYYLYYLDNIYLDYKIDKYELSYAIKDHKITMEEVLENSEIEENDNYKVYKHEKFNVLVCQEDKNIIVNKNERVDYSLCEE